MLWHNLETFWTQSQIHIASWADDWDIWLSILYCHILFIMIWAIDVMA